MKIIGILLVLVGLSTAAFGTFGYSPRNTSPLSASSGYSASALKLDQLTGRDSGMSASDRAALIEAHDRAQVDDPARIAMGSNITMIGVGLAVVGGVLIGAAAATRRPVSPERT